VDLYGASGTRFKLMDGDSETAAIEIVSRDGGLYRLVGNGSEHLIAITEAAHWYTIDLHVDAANGQWDLFIDGEPGVLNAPFSNPASELDRIQIVTGYTERDTVVYVDDVAVYVTG